MVYSGGGDPSNNDIPSSRQVGRYDAKEYWVTAAEWNSPYGSSYELGIRHKHTEKFELLQSRWNERTIVPAANAVVLMLDAGFAVETIRDILNP